MRALSPAARTSVHDRGRGRARCALAKQERATHDAGRWSRDHPRRTLAQRRGRSAVTSDRANQPGGPAGTLAHKRAKPAAADDRKPVNDPLALQRSAGNAAFARLVAGGAPPGHPLAIQRKVTKALTGQPPYADGLDLATIISTAVDKPVLPNLVKPKEIARWEKTNAPKKFDASDKSFLQTGEIHKAVFEYMGLATQLPAGHAYAEYDIAKYASGVRRGPERIVVGTASNGTKVHFYSADHYANFAPFTPA